ncbi:MAG TPA: hypothetical protein VES36_02110 [Candidatus Limnocylindrales bacterium]|nr:hypothetical protein [Candidatus Limnocylindrales bacterium]
MREGSATYKEAALPRVALISRSPPSSPRMAAIRALAESVEPRVMVKVMVNRPDRVPAAWGDGAIRA